MQKAIFLDRDGVINEERGDYTFKSEDFNINNEVIEALKKFINKGFILIVISNQGGIGKGLYSKSDVDKLHEEFLNICRKNFITITAFYFCPHHPTKSNCICRKPDSLLLEKAIARFNIDAKKSFFIGDRERDMKSAEKAGLKGILIQSNESILNYRQYFDI